MYAMHQAAAQLCPDAEPAEVFPRSATASEGLKAICSKEFGVNNYRPVIPGCQC